MHAAAQRDVFRGGEQREFFLGRVGRAGTGGEEHAVAHDAAHLGGFEVGDDDDAAAFQLFGLVKILDARHDHALLVAEVEIEPVERARLGDGLHVDDLRDAQLDLGEVVDGDFRLVLAGVGGEAFFGVRARFGLLLPLVEIDAKNNGRYNKLYPLC